MKTIRLRRLKDGSLRVHDIVRNLIYQIYSFDEKEKDDEGISIVLKTYAQKLSAEDLFKLANRLEKDDTSNYHNWIKNWDYLFSLKQK
jgi:hypothetical protein